MNTNHLPLITDDDLFASDRINIITFDRHFKTQEQDKSLKSRLITEDNISGIFNWCLQGLHKFIDDGLEPPEVVKNATEDYKNDSDKVGKFIIDRLEKTPGKNCRAGDVYSIYQIWCEANGYGCENKANFFAELKYKKIFAENGYVDGNSYQNVVRGYIIKTNETPPPSDKDAPPPWNNRQTEEIMTDLPFPGF
jgi:putative DNA primase/helicase